MANRLFDILKKALTIVKSNRDTLEIIRNSYYDFSKEISKLNGAQINGYAENGMCVIRIVLPKGKTGNFNCGTIPDKYRPRTVISGAIDIINAGADIGRIANVRVYPTGEISTWITTPLSYVEAACICYPMRIDKYLN